MGDSESNDILVNGTRSTTEWDTLGRHFRTTHQDLQPGGTVITTDVTHHTATDARQGTTIVGYNAADLVATHTEPSAGTGGGSPVTTITDDNALRPVQLVRPDGTVVTNECYASGLLRRLTGSQVLPTEFEYDVQGRQTALISWQSFTAGTGKATNRWEFDAERGWLTARRYPDGTSVLGQQFSYGYDDSGNWTSDGRGGDALGQLRLTTYVNNVLDQPTSVANHRHSEVQGAAQATAAVTVNGTSAERQGEYFKKDLYDGWQCIAEFNGSGATRRTHVWGLDLFESRRGAGGLGGLLWLNTATNGTHVAAYGGNGSVLGLIGTNGLVTARYEYGPFGELLRMSGDALAADNPWRWGTKRVDPTTDLVHYEYRVYSPRLGRWLSRDPIGEAGGRNLYAFAGNDPVNSQDVLGLDGGAGALSAVTQGLSMGVQSVEVALAANDALRLALWSCACRNKEFWQGLGSGVWNEVKGLWDGARSVLDAANSAPAIMAKPGAGLAMEMAIAVEVHRVMVGLYDMARNAEFLEILKTLVPEIGVLLTQPIASPDWCKALGSLSGSGAFELLTLLLAPEVTPAKLAALAGKLGPRIGKAADDVAELIARARKLVPEKTGCFVAGTLVATASGLVPIETIQVGDLVWARDESTGEVRLCNVEAAYHRESIPIVEVIVGGEVIATTEEHPFWVQDTGWKNAGELQVGDHLITLNGESVVVQDIRRRPVPEPVYNLKVSGLHTYFVGLGEIWVHNANVCPADGTLTPSEINFSQRTVHGNVTEYIDDMRAGEWDWSISGPLRVMLREGQWVSYDNRRLLAALESGLDSVPVQVVKPTDLMPGSNRTWERAFIRRVTHPRNVEAGGVVPNIGLPTRPTIEPRRAL